MVRKGSPEGTLWLEYVQELVLCVLDLLHQEFLVLFMVLGR